MCLLKDALCKDASVKRCSTSLIIREIQIKTIKRYHLPSVGMGKINNTGNNRCWQGCRERGTLLHFCWEWKLGQPLWKTVWRFLKKLKIELPSDLEIALLGTYSKDTKIQIQRGIYLPMYISKTMEGIQMSIDWWMDKEDVVYVCVYMCVFMYTHTQWNTN